jgi:hypothetical protein
LKRGGAVVALSLIVSGPVTETAIEPGGAESTDVVALAVPLDESWAVFATEPVSAVSTVIVIVAVFVSGAKLKVHATVPFWPDGGVVGQVAVVCDCNHVVVPIAVQDVRRRAYADRDRVQCPVVHRRRAAGKEQREAQHRDSCRKHAYPPQMYDHSLPAPVLGSLAE